MSIPNESPLQILEKMECGRIQGLSKLQMFLGTPIISGTGKATDFLASTFTGLIRMKAHLKFWRKGSMSVSRGCPNFLGTPIISGTGKATDFKFCRNIHRVDRNTSP